MHSRCPTAPTHWLVTSAQLSICQDSDPFPRKKISAFGKAPTRRNGLLLSDIHSFVFGVCFLNCFLIFNPGQCPKLRCNQWLLQPEMFVWKSTNWLTVHANPSKSAYPFFISGNKYRTSENTNYISVTILSSQAVRYFFYQQLTE